MPRGEERASRLEKATAHNESPISVGTRELLSSVSRNPKRLLDRLDEFRLWSSVGGDHEVVFCAPERRAPRGSGIRNVELHVLARAAVHVYAGTKADGREDGVNIDRVLTLLSDAGFAAAGLKVVGNVSKIVAERRSAEGRVRR